MAGLWGEETSMTLDLRGNSPATIWALRADCSAVPQLMVTPEARIDGELAGRRGLDARDLDSEVGGEGLGHDPDLDEQRRVAPVDLGQHDAARPLADLIEGDAGLVDQRDAADLLQRKDRGALGDAMSTASGHARSTVTDSTGTSVATRAATASRSCRASGRPIGTRAASRTCPASRTRTPVTFTAVVDSTEENPSNQTPVPSSASTKTATTQRSQRRRRRGPRCRGADPARGGMRPGAGSAWCWPSTVLS